MRSDQGILHEAQNMASFERACLRNGLISTEREMYGLYFSSWCLSWHLLKDQTVKNSLTESFSEPKLYLLHFHCYHIHECHFAPYCAPLHRDQSVFWCLRQVWRYSTAHAWTNSSVLDDWDTRSEDTRQLCWIEAYASLQCRLAEGVTRIEQYSRL